MDRGSRAHTLAVHGLVYRDAAERADVLAVTGWHTGALGKLVFFIGLATLILEALREAGIELPAAVPDELVLIGLGSLASIFVLVRLASVPDTYFVDTGRGIGLWVALFAAFGLSPPACSGCRKPAARLERRALNREDRFRLVDELVEVERLADEATRTARRRLALAASSTWPLNIRTGIEPAP